MKLAHVVAAAAFLALLPASGHAASFNCAAAATPTEHAICDNPQLGRLDEQTAGMYETMISNGSLSAAQTHQVKEAQISFLRQRDACGANFDCIVSAYTNQMMFLKEMSGQ